MNYFNLFSFFKAYHILLLFVNDKFIINLNINYINNKEIKLTYKLSNINLISLLFKN